VVAGHVIECGAQATGGNYAFFAEVPGLEHVGFPWAEVADDGSSVIGKHDGTGGLVSVGTVTAQLLYEIGGARYANPDAKARFDTVTLGADGPEASQVAYAVEGAFDGFLLHLSQLAAHTKHLLAEPRAHDGAHRGRGLDAADAHAEPNQRRSRPSGADAQFAGAAVRRQRLQAMQHRRCRHRMDAIVEVGAGVAVVCSRCAVRFHGAGGSLLRPRMMRAWRW